VARPRKPTSLKLLDGDRKDRIPADEPQSPMGLGEPPAWLDADARLAWDRVAALLEPMNVATRADSEAIATYAVAYSTWRRALARVDAEGLTLETESTTKPHPCLGIAREAQRQMNRIFSRFGLTPADRACLHVQGRPEDDALMAFFGHTKPPGNGGKGRP
jgi:P27 family predicted phage terminase small subunit